MILGLLLSPGDSLTKQSQSGQLERLRQYYLKPYSRQFKKVFIFSYGDSGRRFALPKNTFLISKPTIVPNSLYQLILPFICLKFIKAIDVFRVFQAAGGTPALISKFVFNKPYVVTYGYDYSAFARIEGRPKLAYLLKPIIFLVLKYARKVIVTDQRNLSINRSVLIPNGVDPSRFKPQNKKAQNLVLSVGRLERQKNYELLIKCISRSKFASKIKLVIIGQGSMKSELLGLAKEVNIDFEIIDQLPHSYLIDWYQRATVFALTSRIEGSPKVLLEAMSCGCPCLTTSFSGNVVKDGITGLLGSGAGQLAKQLDKLMSQPKLRQRLGNNARREIVGRYNINLLVAKEIRLLKQ